MKRKSILIVEDEIIVATDIQDQLEKLGYYVIGISSSAKEAIQEAEKKSPDLILMDIHLKGDGDGINAAQKIRRDLKIPVVYLTADADEKALSRAKGTDPFGYILKPFHERELMTAIEMALYKYETDQKLIEKEQWLAAILNSIGDAVIVTDSEGAISFMNPPAEKITGWKAKEVEGEPIKKIFQLVQENIVPNHSSLEQPEELFVENESGSVHKMLLKNRKGDHIFISESRSPIRDEHHILKGTVQIFRDITKKTKMELELQKIQRLESLGILAGGVAHDFNNLLTAILGNIYAAKKESQKEEKNPERLAYLLNEVEECSFRVKELTQHLLTFSKGGTVKNRKTLLEPFLKKAVRFAIGEASVSWKVQVQPDTWSVDLDTLQVQQVIYNLILNAMQSMGESNGKILVSAKNLVIDHQEKTFPLGSGSYVRITVADEGQGIPRENITKIFDPYFTTKKDGSGLGLAASFAVLSKHDGLLTVESEVGKGSSFYLYFPVSNHNEKG